MALHAAAPVPASLSLHAGRMADRHGYRRPVRIAIRLALCGALPAVASTLAAGAAHMGLLRAAAAFVGSDANLG